MSYFGEVLEDLMKKHKFKAIEICEELKLTKSYFSKIKNGKILPTDFSFIESLSNVMRLSRSEKDMLAMAYKNEKFGGSYNTIEAAIQKIYETEEPMKNLHDSFVMLSKIHDGGYVSGKESIAKVAGQIFTSAEETVNLLFIPENEEFCEAMCQSISAIHQNVNLNWLLYLDNKKGVSAENVSAFSNAIPIILTNRVDVRYSYMELNDYFNHSVFPFLLISEKEALVIERDCMQALYFNNAEVIKVYLKYFKKQFHSAESFAIMFNNFEDFLSDYDVLFYPEEHEKPYDLFIIEKHPCIIHEVERTEIRSHIADCENKEKFTDLYMKFVGNTSINIKTEQIIFSDEGMQEYFEAEEYYEINAQITKPVSKHLRRKCFEKLISYSKNTDIFIPGIIRTPIFEDSHIHLINIWSNGKVLILFNFHSQFRILLVREKSIAMSMIAYFQSLREYGMILSKEDTIALMARSLEYYENHR